VCGSMLASPVSARSRRRCSAWATRRWDAPGRLILIILGETMATVPATSIAGRFPAASAGIYIPAILARSSA
jgi:drug/metabolite transporter superfamily protein YnfA